MSWEAAMFAIQVVSAVSSYEAGQEQAAATNNAAWNNYYANKQILDQQAKEINQSSNNQATERSIQAQIERAKMRTLAGESGLAGNLVDRWMQDSTMQESRDIASIETNRSNQLRQNLNQQGAQYAKAQGQSNEAYSKAPSLLGTGLQIAGAGGSYGAKTEGGTKSTPIFKT